MEYIVYVNPEQVPKVGKDYFCTIIKLIFNTVINKSK